MTRASVADKMNGTRHPHAAYAPLGRTVNSVRVRAAIVAFAVGDMAMMPPDTAPRRRGGVHSMARGIAAEYWPPRKIPPRKRMAMTVYNVHTPQDVWGGTTAIPMVVAAIPARVITEMRVRPRRSAQGPKRRDPRGRPMSVATNTSPALVARFSAPNRVAVTGANAMTGTKMSNWST